MPGGHVWEWLACLLQQFQTPFLAVGCLPDSSFCGINVLDKFSIIAVNISLLITFETMFVSSVYE